MEDLHHRLIRIGLDALAEDFGYRLAGGYAVQAHRLASRVSDDVDLFTPIGRAEGDLPQAIARLAEAYRTCSHSPVRRPTNARRCSTCSETRPTSKPPTPARRSSGTRTTSVVPSSMTSPSVTWNCCGRPAKGRRAGRRAPVQTAAASHRVDQPDPQRAAQPRTPRRQEPDRGGRPHPVPDPRSHSGDLAQRQNRSTRQEVAGVTRSRDRVRGLELFSPCRRISPVCRPAR